MPNKRLLLDCAEHDQNQTDGGEIALDAKDNSETSGQLSCSQEDREAFTHSDVFASLLRVFEVFPSAHDEHEPDHDAQQKERHVGEAS